MDRRHRVGLSHIGTLARKVALSRGGLVVFDETTVANLEIEEDGSEVPTPRVENVVVNGIPVDPETAARRDSFIAELEKATGEKLS